MYSQRKVLGHNTIRINNPYTRVLQRAREPLQLRIPI